MAEEGDRVDAVEIFGFCDERFEPLERGFRSNQVTGLDEGASLAVTLGGELVVDLWAGTTDRERTIPWKRDTIVNVFSSGKFAVNLPVLMLYDRGLLDLHAPIAEYWPQFGQCGKGTITTWHVLTHSSGLPGFGRPMSFAEICDWDLTVGVLERALPIHEPGTQSYYHSMNYGFLLGEVVKRVSGRPFDEFFEDEIARPARADFHFGVTDPIDQVRIARLWYPDKATMPEEYEDPVFNEVEVPDLGRPENLRAVLPSFGACGNGRSLARLASILATGGELDGVRYLSDATVAEAASEQSYLVDQVLGRLRMGLGFGLDSDEFPAPTPEFIHWGGFGGSFVGADPRRGVAVGFAPNQLLAEPDPNPTPRSAQRLLTWIDSVGSVLLALD